MLQHLFEICSLLATEVGGAIICPYPLPQVLGEYLQLQRRRAEALFSYSFILEIFCNSSSFLVQLLTEQLVKKKFRHGAPTPPGDIINRYSCRSRHQEALTGVLRNIQMNIRGHKGCMTHKVFKSNTIYEIMETMCPPRYHRNIFVAIHALGHMMYECLVLKCMTYHKAIVLITGSAHCFHDSI